MLIILVFFSGFFGKGSVRGFCCIRDKMMSGKNGNFRSENYIWQMCVVFVIF